MGNTEISGEICISEIRSHMQISYGCIAGDLVEEDISSV